MADLRIKIAGHHINISSEHIKSFKSKDVFLKAQMKTLENLGIENDALESALGDAYELLFPPKVKKEN